MIETEAWFDCVGLDRSIETSIRETLTLQGIRLHPYNGNAAHHSGILCLWELNEQVLNILLDRGRAQRVIVVSIRADALGSSWKLLRAGAADVLVWSEGDSIGAQIKARFERWSTIDALVADAVRESLVGESQTWKRL